ncbi:MULTISPECIES: hypothetical protein [Bacillus]|uniref:hypothetical protein n=1 Tax=Bacillus TaxID=1386 RepID=UPI00273EF931|nr:hypothetical protein [Bacillus sp. MMSF_3328]
MRVLLAVGEPNMTSILRNHLVSSGFDVIEQEVFHRRFLEEVIQYEKPAIIFLHDSYLESDHEELRDRDQEILRMIEQWRFQYNDSLRIVYICERERTDPLLGSLVARNVLDIFYTRSIPTQLLINQILEPPKFSNVAKIGVTDIDLANLEYLEEQAEKSGIEDEITEFTEHATQPAKPIDIPTSKSRKKVELPSLKLPKPEFHIHVHKPSKIRTEKIAKAIDRKIVVVISPFERSGSTFVSHQLAYQIAERKIGITYFENPFKRPYTYDRFGGHLLVPNFKSLYTSQPNANIDIDRKWTVEGVQIQALNPILEMPYEEKDISIEKFLRLFLSAGDTPILIVDIGADRQRPIYDELLSIASHVLVVMDCDISNMEWFEQNQISPDFNWIHKIITDERTTLIANRYVEAAADAFPPDKYVSIPVINQDWIFESHLKATFSWKGREAVRVQHDVFGGLMQHLFPDETLTGQKKANLHIKNWLPKIKVGK